MSSADGLGFNQTVVVESIGSSRGRGYPNPVFNAVNADVFGWNSQQPNVNPVDMLVAPMSSGSGPLVVGGDFIETGRHVGPPPALMTITTNPLATSLIALRLLIPAPPGVVPPGVITVLSATATSFCLKIITGTALTAETAILLCTPQCFFLAHPLLRYSSTVVCTATEGNNAIGFANMSSAVQAIPVICRGLVTDAVPMIFIYLVVPSSGLNVGGPGTPIFLNVRITL